MEKPPEPTIFIPCTVNPTQPLAIFRASPEPTAVVLAIAVGCTKCKELGLASTGPIITTGEEALLLQAILNPPEAIVVVPAGHRTVLPEAVPVQVLLTAAVFAVLNCDALNPTGRAQFCATATTLPKNSAKIQNLRIKSLFKT
jgi:hypothetical protein